MTWMIMAGSPVGRIGRQIGGDLGFPAVAVVQQLLLVVEEFLPGFGSELEVRTLDDGVDRAGFLAQPAIDTFGHVDVVARRPAAAIRARLGLDGDGLGRADRLAELAGDAALLAAGVAAQGMLPPEAGAQRTLLIGVVDGDPGLKQIAEGQLQARQQLIEQQAPSRARQYCHRLTTFPGFCSRLMPRVIPTRALMPAAIRRPPAPPP